MHDPRLAYSQRLAERRADIARYEQRHRMLGNWQLAIAIAGAIILWMSLVNRSFSFGWILLPIVLFVMLAVLHDRVLRQMEYRRRSERYFLKALARLDGKWAGTGESGERYLDPAHSYAKDLDLFGKGSLFELLCTARTHIGEETLARWLSAPADPETIRARHEAVNELRPRLDLREDLAVLAEETRTGVEPTALAQWSEAPPSEARWLPFAVHGLTLLSLSILFAMIAFPSVLLRVFFFTSVVINIVFRHQTRKQIEEMATIAEHAGHEIKLLSAVLLRLEREDFQSPLLAGLKASLKSEGDPPSKRLAQLNHRIDFLLSRRNPAVQGTEPLTLWTANFALAVENWRRHNGAAVRRWLTATGEIEALSSLASHAFEHPTDSFPEFSKDAPLLDAEDVGHPLIPEDRVVRNDIRIGGPLRVLIISGSNMSGKSTLLRTIGINAILAQAGAPVRAKRLRLSPLAIGASIRISDSLQDGISRFYAEILRIRQILDLTAGPQPVLFLIDEFLHGTNSHDRRIGAEALVRSLVERGAVGLVTTHDLALADITGVLGEHAANVHFEDQIADGKIHFDYKMRPGVVRKSNAIALMRSVGLEI